MALINHNIIISEKHRIFLWCYMHVVVQWLRIWLARSSVAWQLWLIWRSATARTPAQYQSLHCLLVVAEHQMSTVAHATLLLANQILRHIVLQHAYSITRIFYVFHWLLCWDLWETWHYSTQMTLCRNGQVYAALNSVTNIHSIETYGL